MMERGRIPVPLTSAVSLVFAFLVAGTVGLFNERASNANEGKVQNGTPQPAGHLPKTIEEARSRARLLHETMHGTLQVVHRDFFREDEGLAIPSHSLEDVFQVLARDFDVKLRWLAVNTEAMNVDNKPQTEFEKSAAKVLSTGQLEFESIEAGRYMHAGTIRLASECLKCHVPNRTSNEDRAAALVISMPIQKK